MIDLAGLADSKNAPFNICIIGGGAAGLSLAQSLDPELFSICLLESGKENPTQEAQSLNESDCIGLGYDLQESRCRALGGTLHTWQGTIAPLDPIALAQRDWIPHSGWPISPQDLQPTYQAACRILGVADADRHFAPLSADQTAQVEGFGVPTDTFRTKPFVLMKMQLEQLCDRLKAEVLKRENVTCVTNATVIEIVPDQAKNGTISHVRARSTDGATERRIHADRFIICTGGLETPRLLLASRQLAAAGLGNDNDLVGRYFMDHPRLRSTAVPLAKAIKAPVLRHVTAGNCGFKSGLVLKDDIQKERRLANYNVFLTNVGIDLERQAAKVFAAQDKVLPHANGARTNVKSARIRTMQGLRRLWRTLPVRARVAIETAVSQQAFRNLAFVLKMEQVPNPDSRIFLSEETDRFDMPKLVLDWRLSELDHRILDDYISILRSSFAAKGFDTDGLDFRGPDRQVTFQDSSHPMGATRMAHDATQGVVDRNLTVFGTKNLSVCSSSVFPTGCNANPTLTIVALAARLAGYLNSEQAQSAGLVTPRRESGGRQREATALSQDEICETQ